MARPGTGEIRKVGRTWDKQDITPHTRKIPYLISSSYSGNIVYVYNLDGESRRSRLGSCFYDSLDLAFYNSHRIATNQVICLVTSLDSEHLQVQSPRRPHKKTVPRSQQSCFW